jgi:7tm Chemosensory receptor
VFVTILGIVEIFYPCQTTQSLVSSLKNGFELKIGKFCCQKLAEILDLAEEIIVEDLLKDKKAKEVFQKFSKQLQRNPLEFSVFGFYVITYSLLASVSKVCFVGVVIRCHR